MSDQTCQVEENGSVFSKCLKQADIDSRMLTMIMALLVIWVVLNFLTGGIFFTARNMYNLAVQTSVVGIMATGMVLVIVCRHIDLSVGSLLGFAGMVIAFLQVDVFPIDASWNWPLTIICGLALAGIAGLWQGWWIAYRGIPSFVITLAGLMMFRGAAYLVTDGRTVAPMNKTYQILGGGIDGSIGATWSWILAGVAIAWMVINTIMIRRSCRKYGFKGKPLMVHLILLAIGIFLVCGFVMVMNAYTKPRTDISRGIPVPVLIMIAVAVGMSLLAKVTRFGRYVFAIGGNPEAAELSGIAVKRITAFVFIIMGLLCGVAAVITTARLNAGANSMGNLAELNVIAATIIGGTSMRGGKGTIAGAILGAVIMQSLDSGMVLLGISSSMRQVVMGIVLIFAVWFDVVYNKNRS